MDLLVCYFTLLFYLHYLFHLDRLFPSTTRTFTLIAKTIQNLANLVEFGDKEPYMKPMNSLIIENKEKMKNFLTNISVSFLLQ